MSNLGCLVDTQDGLAPLVGDPPGANLAPFQTPPICQHPISDLLSERYMKIKKKKQQQPEPFGLVGGLSQGSFKITLSNNRKF